MESLKNNKNVAASDLSESAWSSPSKLLIYIPITP